MHGSQAHGATLLHVSFDAFQKLFPTSFISAPIQILVKLGEALMVPVMVSWLPELITVLMGGLNDAILAPAGTEEVTINEFNVAGPVFGFVIV